VEDSKILGGMETCEIFDTWKAEKEQLIVASLNTSLCCDVWGRAKGQMCIGELAKNQRSCEGASHGRRGRELVSFPPNTALPFAPYHVGFAEEKSRSEQISSLNPGQNQNQKKGTDRSPLSLSLLPSRLFA